MSETYCTETRILAGSIFVCINPPHDQDTPGPRDGVIRGPHAHYFVRATPYQHPPTQTPVTP